MSSFLSRSTGLQLMIYVQTFSALSFSSRISDSQVVTTFPLNGLTGLPASLQGMKIALSHPHFTVQGWYYPDHEC